MNFKTLVTTFACALLLGCASQTPYAPAPEAGEPGYSEAKLGENRYRVTFNGNSSTGKSAVQDYALLRAAELTLQEGHDWFQIVQRDSEREKTTRTSPGVSGTYATDRVVTRDCGLLGCTTTSRPATTATVGVGTETERVRYETTIELLMGGGAQPDDAANVYDASETASAIRKRM